MQCAACCRRWKLESPGQCRWRMCWGTIMWAKQNVKKERSLDAKTNRKHSHVWRVYPLSVPASWITDPSPLTQWHMSVLWLSSPRAPLKTEERWLCGGCTGVAPPRVDQNKKKYNLQSIVMKGHLRFIITLLELKLSKSGPHSILRWLARCIARGSLSSDLRIVIILGH